MYFNVASRIFVFKSQDNFSQPYKRIWSKFSLRRFVEGTGMLYVEKHSMLRVWVCAAHMGGFSGPKFSKQWSLFQQIFLKHGWVIQKLAKSSQKWAVFHQNSS